jgi:plastocyanin
MALAAVLGASVVVLPAVASSEATPTIEAAHESGLYGGYRWKPPSATISAGGTVAFSNPSTEVPHGIEWKSGPATPSCSQEVPVGTNEAAAGKHWSGSCAFSQPGTYEFWCTVHHSEMKGTISVTASGTTSTTTTNTSPAPTPGTGAPGGGGTGAPNSPSAVGGSESPLAGPASSAVKVAASQHGTAVRGSVDISQAGEGDRVEVDALAKAAALAGNGHAAPVRVGKLVLSHVHSGKTAFSIKLSSRARSALRRHHRLALSVRIAVTPLVGSPLTIMRSVVLHA